MDEENIVWDLDGIIKIPEDTSVGHFIFNKFKEHGSKTFMVDSFTGESVTYEWVLTKAIQTLQFFKSINLENNDIISIICENNVKYFVPIVAASFMGLTMAPLDPTCTTYELLHMIRIIKPKLVFCTLINLDILMELREQLPFLQYIITFESNVNIKGVLGFDQMFLKLNNEENFNFDYNEIAKCNPNDKVLFILSSSGTTGLPKGVMITHLNVFGYLCMLDNPNYLYLFEDTNKLGLMPFCHSYGLMMLFVNIKQATKLFIMKKLDPDIFLTTIQNFKISSLHLFPPILEFLAKSPFVDKYDLTCLKHILTGGSELNSDINELLEKRLKVAYIKNGYALTETTSAGCATFKHLSKKDKRNSIGIPMPTLKCKIVDIVDGHALGSNKRGEICFKGTTVMKGYYNNPEATKQIIDEDGWLHTGDIGYYDEDKIFYFVDRLKDLINYKEFQVAPAELEAVLLNHPKIADAAVIGIPNEIAGELPMAFVVTKEGAELNSSEVKQYVAERVTDYQKLRGGVRFVKIIPRSSSGNILRRCLKDLFVK